MLKAEALLLLGGTVTSAAREIGITSQAVGQWPDQLSPPIRDRVQAALWRRYQREQVEARQSAEHRSLANTTPGEAATCA
jgi:transposase-like protein